MNINKEENKSSFDIFFEQMLEQAKVQNIIKHYAVAMGWGPKQNLPAAGQKWGPDDYLSAVDRISKTIINTVTGFRKESIELKTAPPKKEVNEVEKQGEAIPEHKDIPEDIQNYLNSGSETADGFVDQYGNFLQGANGTKLTKQQIETYVRQNDNNANEIRNTINMSRAAYEDMQKKAISQQAPATGQIQEPTEQKPSE